jgi:hypothetical protein
MPYSLSMTSHIVSSFLRYSLSIHQQPHCHSSPYCPFLVVLILMMTDKGQLSGTIPTEFGRLTDLYSLELCKYDGCVRSFHPLLFIYKLTYLVLFSPLFDLNSPTTPLSFIAKLSIFVILMTTDSNQLFGTIPTEIGQLTRLDSLCLREYDGCVRCFHSLCFICKLTTGAAVSSISFEEQKTTL